MRYFEVSLKRSYEKRTERLQRILAGLGLRHINQTVCIKDTPAVRGMIYKVVQLVSITSKQGEMPPSKRQQARAKAVTVSA